MASIASELSQIKIGTTSTTAVVPEVKSIKVGAVTQSPIDITHLSSTAKENRAGIPDNGSLSFEVQFDPADTVHKLIRTSASNRANLYYDVVFSDGSKASGQGFITSFELSVENEAQLMASVELKINSVSYTDPS